VTLNQAEYQRELDALIKRQQAQRKHYEQSSGQTQLELLQIDNQEKLELAQRYHGQTKS
jgi:hypothetical protein